MDQTTDAYPIRPQLATAEISCIPAEYRVL